MARFLNELLEISNKIDHRKTIQSRRLDILNDNGYLHIDAALQDTFTDPLNFSEMKKHLDLSQNALKLIINKIAQVYRLAPLRKFENREDTDLFAAVVDPQIDNAMEVVNKITVTCKECFARPVIRNDMVEIDIIPPHLVDVIWSGNNPIALMYKTEAGMIYIDAQEELLIDKNGIILYHVPNLIGEIPVILYRSEYPTLGGWVGTSGEDLVYLWKNQTLFSTWISIIAWLQSHKELYRKPIQSTDFGTQVGAVVNEAPAGPHTIHEGDLGVLDLRSDIRPLLEAQNTKLQAVASAYGISAEVMAESKATSGSERELSQIGLNEARENQIKMFRGSDLKLMRVICLLWNSVMNPKFSLSPASINYREPKRIATPLEQAQLDEIQVRLGQISVVDILQRENPDIVDREAALAIVKRNLAETGEVLKSRQDYNSTSEAVAKITGSVGGAVSAAFKDDPEFNK